MANKTLFGGAQSTAPTTDTFNSAGGKAYSFTAKHALAQIAATNCFNGTYYVDAEENLKLAKEAVAQIKDAEFLAKVAVYSRSKSYMKDMPAFLVATLAGLDTKLFRRVFPKVIDNGKMLRNFVQMARSGQCGRTFNISSGAIRKALNDWFRNHSSYSIFKASVGNDPSMRDILRMCRPKPENKEKAALYAYLKGAEFRDGKLVTLDREGKVYVNAAGQEYSHNWLDLPQIVLDYESYKEDRTGPVPNVDFRMLDSLGLGQKEWSEIARNAPWTMTRMNLNTFQRHGVFDDKKMIRIVADKIRNKEEISKARAFPYQLLMAYKATGSVPHEISEALQDAMEHAVENVPEFNGQIYVAVDVSGSMGSSITGNRGFGQVSSAVRCVDVAALFAASVLRKNRSAVVLPFDTQVHNVRLNGRDSVMTNAQRLASFGGGGTNCALAIETLNANAARGDAIIFVSDCESWVDSPYANAYAHLYPNRNNPGTGMMNAWTKFKQRNKNAKLICIDLTPRNNSQVKEREDILQVGGFSDQVFEVVKTFLDGGNGPDHWVSEIEKTEI